MTAYRVIDLHSELGDVSGTLSHQQIDRIITDLLTTVSSSLSGSIASATPSGSYLVVNSSNGEPTTARKFKAGPGILISDGGPGGFFTASVDANYIKSVVSGSGGFYTPPTQIWLEPVSGSVNGTNTTFATKFSPNPSGSLHLYWNGLVQQMNKDYHLTGSQINWVGSAPKRGCLLATYQK